MFSSGNENLPASSFTNDWVLYLWFMLFSHFCSCEEFIVWAIDVLVLNLSCIPFFGYLMTVHAQKSYVFCFLGILLFSLLFWVFFSKFVRSWWVLGIEEGVLFCPLRFLFLIFVKIETLIGSHCLSWAWPCIKVLDFEMSDRLTNCYLHCLKLIIDESYCKFIYSWLLLVFFDRLIWKVVLN